MTDEQINEAIAEICGWRLVEKQMEMGYSLRLWMTPFGEEEIDALNYCGCLNAMHEAEKLLFPKHEIAWHEQLTYVCGGSWIIMLTATARQRAEAFLRTMGKWKEAK
jgi:hypothetical protein